MKSKKVILLGSVFLLASGCKKDEVVPPASTLSCNVTTLNQCVDFGDGYTEATAQPSCEALEGTFSATGLCTTTASAGKCTKTSSGLTLIVHYYSTGSIPYTAELVSAACTEDGGTFAAE